MATATDEKFTMESLVGASLLKHVKGTAVSTNKEAFKSTSKGGLVGLYFSASWCPPCQRFTPLLIDFYNAAKASNGGLQIVFVSSDRSSEEFDKYYGKMPWLAIPSVTGSAEIKQNLSETLGVTTIPSLAIIDATTGEFVIGGEARDDVVASSEDPEKVKAVLEKWKGMERKPFSEAPALMDMGMGSQNHFFRFLSFLAKNPMIIFGLIYFYQWMQRKMIEMGYDDDNSGVVGEEVPPPVEDTEF